MNVRKFKKYILLLIPVICVILVFYFSKKDDSIIFGDGTINDPYVIIGSNNQQKLENDQKIIQFFGERNMQLVEIRPDQSSDLQNVLSYYYGTYKVDSINDQKEIIITNIQFIDQLLGKWFLVASNADALPKCLLKYQSNESLEAKLIKEKIENNQIVNYIDLFGKNWNSTITDQDIKKIENCIFNDHSFITITYLINDHGKWYSSSIIKEWNEYESNSINQKISLPVEVIENGQFSLNINMN